MLEAIRRISIWEYSSKLVCLPQKYPACYVLPFIAGNIRLFATAKIIRFIEIVDIFLLRKVLRELKSFRGRFEGEFNLRIFLVNYLPLYFPISPFALKIVVSSNYKYWEIIDILVEMYSIQIRAKLNCFSSKIFFIFIFLQRLKNYSFINWERNQRFIDSRFLDFCEIVFLFLDATASNISNLWNSSTKISRNP